MKNPYGKPTIIVEPFAVDRAGATSCTADRDDMFDLMELGYFTTDRGCEIVMAEDGSIGGYDTICYHSNVQIAFTS